MDISRLSRQGSLADGITWSSELLIEKFHRYRYRIDNTHGTGKPVIFIGLNPSLAGSLRVSDPTVQALTQAMLGTCHFLDPAHLPGGSRIAPATVLSYRAPLNLMVHWMRVPGHREVSTAPSGTCRLVPAWFLPGLLPNKATLGLVFTQPAGGFGCVVGKNHVCARAVNRTQRLQRHGAAVNPAVCRGGLNHGVLPRHLVRRHRHR